MTSRPRLLLISITILIIGLTTLGTARAFETERPNVSIDADLPIQYSVNGMIADEVIIEFNSYAESRAAQAANALPGVDFDSMMTSRPVARYRIIDGTTPFEVITRLRNFSQVREVYPNYRRSLALIPNDPYFSLQQEELQVSQIPAAWDIETGSSDVLVGVIDTGVDYTHPDLIPNLVLPGVNVRGDAAEDEVMDDSGHGTAVSGVIGAVGNNGIGVAGLSWSVRMLPIRACGGPFLDCDLFDEVEGIDVARERGCNIINLSIGGVGTISIEEEAVTEAYNAGCVIVAAAGNGNPGKLFEATGDPEVDRHALYYPAALPEVIGVGAVDNTGQKPDFSNYGEDILSLMAPGVDIVTTVPEDEVYLYTGEGPPYGLATGTSFSTPMVSGAAALVLSHFPGLSPDDVRARLEGTAIPMAGPDNDGNGVNDYYGYGILNAAGALSQGGTSGNQYLTVAVSENPIFAGEVLVMVQALVPLDSSPTVSWSLRDGGGGGIVVCDEVETRPGFYIGRFAPPEPGNLSISVSGMSGGAPVASVQVLYLLGGD
jgi:subtilisin family serine protease